MAKHLVLRTALLGMLLACGLAFGQTYNTVTITGGGSLKGNGANTLSSAAATDITALWSGTCNASDLLRGDGTCSTTLSAAEPRLLFNETDVGANLKLWDFDCNASVCTRRTRTDADGAGQTFETVTRGTTTNVTSVQWNTTGGFAPAQMKLDSQASLFLETTYDTGDLSFDVKNNSNAALGTSSIDLFAGTGANSVNAVYTSFNAAASMLSQFGSPAPATGGVAFYTITSAAALNGTIMLAPNTVPGLIMLGDNSLSTFYMPLTSTGAVTGASFRPSSSTVPPNGLYLPAANTIGWSTNTTNRLNIDSAGTWLLAGASGTAGNVLTSAGPGAPPTWAAGGSAVGANPSALVGLTAVNGAAATFTRSDGAPALDQGIIPTWTGNHTWSKVEPRLLFNDTGGGANGKLWDLDVTPTLLTLRTRTDADAAGVQILGVTRSAASTAITGIALGNATNNNSLTFSGTGTVTSQGKLVAAFAGTNGTAASVDIDNASPAIGMRISGGAADGRVWDTAIGNTTYNMRAVNDANNSVRNFLSVSRTSNSINITGLAFGDVTGNPVYNFLGTGAVTIGTAAGGGILNSQAGQTAASNGGLLSLVSGAGGATSGSSGGVLITTGATVSGSSGSVGIQTAVPTSGAAGDINLNSGAGSASGSNKGGDINETAGAGGAANGAGGNIALTPGTRAGSGAPGMISLVGPVTQAGTKFTTTGCSVSATTGGATNGVFTLGANTCTVVITMGGANGAVAANGWTCDAHDRTAPTVLIGGESSSTTSTASITIPAGAGATDVISFSCLGY